MTQPKRLIFQRRIALLAALALCALPLIAQGSLWSRLGLTGNHTKDVATEVADLHEDGNVYGLAFSPDGRELATVLSDQLSIHVWDWRAGRIIPTFKKVQGGWQAEAPMPLAYSPDGRFLATCQTGTGDVVIQVWNAKTGAPVHDMADSLGGVGCNSIAFSPDSRRLFAALDRFPKTPGDNVRAYSTRTWQPVWGLRTGPLGLNTLAVSPNGQFLAAGGLTYVPPDAPHPYGALQTRIVIIDIARRAIVRGFAAFPIAIPGHISNLWQLAWSPDGVHLAASLGDAVPGTDAVRIFDARTGALVTGETTPDESDIYGLRYTPNGKYLIESTLSGHVLIWDGQHRHLLQSIRGEPECLAVSADSRYLALGGDHQVQVWRLK